MKIATILATITGLMLIDPALAQGSKPTDQQVEVHLEARSQQAVAGINRFSLDLYTQSVSAQQNLFISPASVSTAISLAYRGAKGATAEELRRTLHYDASPAAYLAASAPVLKSLNVSGKGRTLRIVNALWLQQGLPLLPDFVADVTRYAQAGIQRTDFRHDPDGARFSINRWVAEATNERIKELLRPGDITDQTRAALVNSIYWKGRWATPFPIGLTKLEPFLDLHGRRTQTPLMHVQADFRAIERAGVKAIELPYASDEVSMVILLPDTPADLPRFEAALTDRELARWLHDLEAAHPRDTVVNLPKMHMEWRDDLVPILQRLGAGTAFNDAADFSGMATEPFPSEVPGAVGLKIKKVIHQTYLDVDEQGSEAAAATAVVEIIVTGARRRPPPFIFRADKPFLFLLKDRRTKLILFMGRYVTPATQ